MRFKRNDPHGVIVIFSLRVQIGLRPCKNFKFVAGTVGYNCFIFKHDKFLHSQLKCGSAFNLSLSVFGLTPPYKTSVIIPCDWFAKNSTVIMTTRLNHRKNRLRMKQRQEKEVRRIIIRRLDFYLNENSMIIMNQFNCNKELE